MNNVHPKEPSVKAVEILQKLIAFPTVSRDSNLDLIYWIRDYLGTLGVPCRLTYDASGKKANLFASLGSGNAPGIILSGHTDVVPTEGQAWDSDPFNAVIKDGAVYGRGTADMKGFIAVTLAMAPKFIEGSHDFPVHFAFSYDEEVGCLGVRGLIKDLQDIGLNAAGCIVGEPTSMQPLNAHKGMYRFRCSVHGKEAHSSYTPLGVNAIEYAARVIHYIRNVADELAVTEPKDTAFTVPYSTMQTGLVRGGLAANIVPKTCEFEFDVRTMPNAKCEPLIDRIKYFADSLLPEMKKVDPNASIEIECMSATPGMSIAESTDLVRLVKRLSGSENVSAASYNTEAGLFQEAGIPTVVCGPGDIVQAHRPNEFVSLEQLAKCEDFLEALINSASGKIDGNRP
ncbi:MAG TPA: acetylornithine deacetylase [Noviherbaspirillum sp.]